MTEDEVLDELYGTPLDEFTRRRNELARELGDAGDKEAAARLKGLKKPNVSAWAVNQVARRHPDDIARLIEMHERVAGASGSKELRGVTDERRRLIAAIESKAAAVLREAGHSAAGTTMQKISQTLLAAASGEGTEEVRSGRLTTDLDVPGFGAMEGFELAADSPPFERSDDKARERAEQLDRLAREAESEAADAARAAESASLTAERLVKEAETAARRAETARAKADKALDELN